jgi:hypothetical protein
MIHHLDGVTLMPIGIMIRMIVKELLAPLVDTFEVEHQELAIGLLMLVSLESCQHRLFIT